MVFLKDDGSLDLVRINRLPVEEHMKMLGELTDEQCDYYLSTLPDDDSSDCPRNIFVDYTLEDELKRGSVILKDYIAEKMEKYGIKRRKTT